jgi:hypothetical protein
MAKNEQIINKKLLESVDPLKTKMLIVHDDDDLLNPQETIRRYELGIDTTFMVKHLGQGNLDISTLTMDALYLETEDSMISSVTSMPVPQFAQMTTTPASINQSVDG